MPERGGHEPAGPLEPRAVPAPPDERRRLLQIPSAASTASSWQPTSARDTSRAATANSTLTLFGAENVRSSAATRVSRSRSTSPERGSRPAISAPNCPSSTRPSSPRLAAPAPTHRPGASPRPV